MLEAHACVGVFWEKCTSGSECDARISLFAFCCVAARTLKMFECVARRILNPLASALGTRKGSLGVPLGKLVLTDRMV